jgi:hypothetical protein
MLSGRAGSRQRDRRIRTPGVDREVDERAARAGCGARGCAKADASAGGRLIFSWKATGRSVSQEVRVGRAFLALADPHGAHGACWAVSVVRAERIAASHIGSVPGVRPPPAGANEAWATRAADRRVARFRAYVARDWIVADRHACRSASSACSLFVRLARVVRAQLCAESLPRRLWRTIARDTRRWLRSGRRPGPPAPREGPPSTARAAGSRVSSPRSTNVSRTQPDGTLSRRRELHSRFTAAALERRAIDGERSSIIVCDSVAFAHDSQTPRSACIGRHDCHPPQCVQYACKHCRKSERAQVSSDRVRAENSQPKICMHSFGTRAAVESRDESSLHPPSQRRAPRASPSLRRALSRHPRRPVRVQCRHAARDPYTPVLP